MRLLLAVVAVVLVGFLATATWPLPVPTLALLLTCLAVLESPVLPGCLGLGLPGDHPPIERDGP